MTGSSVRVTQAAPIFLSVKSSTSELILSRRLNQSAFESAYPVIPWHIAGVDLAPPALRELPQPAAYWGSFNAPVRQTPHRPRHRRRGDIRRSEVSNSSTERRDSWRGKPLISFDLSTRFRS